MTAPLPPREIERLEALREVAILDTPPEADYDDLARLAATICGTPISLVSLVDPSRQWFKSRYGIDATETSRDIAFCSHAILHRELFTVPNAAEDERFRSNPLVTGEPNIRFYAGMPLATPEGYNLGTLCVIDRVPRHLTADQIDALRVLAHQVVSLLVSRRQVAELQRIMAAKERSDSKLRASEQRFQAFMDRSPAVAFMKDEAGRYAYVNEAIVRRFGMPREAWLGHSDEQIFPHEETAVWRENDRRVLAGEQVVEFEEDVPEAAGDVSHWHTYKFPFVDGQGVRYLAGMGLDVTERKRMMTDIHESKERFRRLLQELAEGVVLLDRDSRQILDCNLAFLELLGYDERDVAGLTHYDFAAHSREDIDEKMRLIERVGRHSIGFRKYRRKDGSIVDVSVSGRMLTLEGRKALCLVVQDMTEQIGHRNRLLDYQAKLEEANARLLEQATTDGLTRVNNRAWFNERIAEECVRSRRNQRPLSVIMMDVDHFKSFNDTFGHPAGDEVLKEVAATLKGSARASDMVARYGGEEFVVILPETDAEGAFLVAERLREAIERADWPERAITVSVGVATWDAGDAGDAEARHLIQAADGALYESKRAGRNRVSHCGGVSVGR